jgi:hypothetical protein
MRGCGKQQGSGDSVKQCSLQAGCPSQSPRKCFVAALGNDLLSFAPLGFTATERNKRFDGQLGGLKSKRHSVSRDRRDHRQRISEADFIELSG